MLKTLISSVVIVVLLTSCNQPIQLAPDAILPDGGVYQGEIKEGLFHGEGTINYPEGSYYKGLFEKGLYHGQGKFVFADGVSYEGEFSKGQISGKFVMKIPKDNLHYDGDLVDGYMQGQGRLTVNDYVYVGGFKDRLFSGQGKISYTNESTYEGEFVEGSYHGKGRFSKKDSWYEGDFVDGNLSGQGEYVDEEGNRYIGEVKSWQAHGKGELIKADGSILKGSFKNGYLEGFGEETTADGSVYKGMFFYGYYHGQGKLVTKGKESGKEQVLEGRWRRGRLVFNSQTGEMEHAEAELALENHQENLTASLSTILKGDSQTNMYFLGVAGDGSQSVFRRELEFVSQQVEQKYGTQGRSVLLINDHKTAKNYPMATRRSIASAITSIGEKMDNNDDILFLYLSSHGSKQHELYLNHDSISLPWLPSNELSKMLSDAQIKWKVIMISACYSGGFIPELEDDTTLIMTASDSISTSFGCSDDAEMTYFGKALFKEVIAKNKDIKLSDAYAQSKDIILGWEKDEALSASNPVFAAPQAIVDKLQRYSELN